MNTHSSSSLNSIKHNNSNTGNGNPYVLCSPISVSSPPSNGGSGQRVKVFGTLGRYGKMLENVATKAEVMADDIWNHLKMSPNISNAAMARLSQATKAVAHGGYDKIFEQTFPKLGTEKLLHTYACHLSTLSGPLLGTLYVSDKRIAFCSDFPLSHCSSPATTINPNCLYYKVVIQKEQLRKVNISANQWRPSEKYINIVTSDGHEFWFMGFISYDNALKSILQLNAAQIIPIN